MMMARYSILGSYLTDITELQVQSHTDGPMKTTKSLIKTVLIDVSFVLQCVVHYDKATSARAEKANVSAITDQ